MMTYTVEMHRTPEVTPEEAQRRLALVYQFLLDLAAKHGRPTPDEAGDSAANISDVKVDPPPEGER